MSNRHGCSISIFRGSTASFEEKVEYHYLKEFFGACRGCIREPSCWHPEGACYYPGVILEVCPNENLRSAVEKLRIMEGNGLNYILHEDYDAVMLEVKKRFRKSVRT